MTPSSMSLQINRGHLTFSIAETDDDSESYAIHTKIPRFKYNESRSFGPNKTFSQSQRVWAQPAWVTHSTLDDGPKSASAFWSTQSSAALP